MRKTKPAATIPVNINEAKELRKIKYQEKRAEVLKKQRIYRENNKERILEYQRNRAEKIKEKLKNGKKKFIDYKPSGFVLKETEDSVILPIGDINYETRRSNKNRKKNKISRMD